MFASGRHPLINQNLAALVCSGCYSCILLFHVGFIASWTLWLQWPIKCLAYNNSLPNSVIPEIELTASPPVVQLGSSTTLTCNVTRAKPTDFTTYTWTHGNSSTVLPETGNILTLSAVRGSDLGVYHCKVTNSAGTGSGTFNLELGSKCLYILLLCINTLLAIKTAYIRNLIPDSPSFYHLQLWAMKNDRYWKQGFVYDLRSFQVRSVILEPLTLL